MLLPTGLDLVSKAVSLVPTILHKQNCIPSWSLAKLRNGTKFVFDYTPTPKQALFLLNSTNFQPASSFVSSLLPFPIAFMGCSSETVFFSAFHI